jgi:cytidine deaminase
VRKAKNPLKFKLIVIRVSMEDQQTLKNSMPCKYCRDYLLNVGFKTIFCSNDDGDIVKVKLNDLPDYESGAQKNHRLGIIPCV